MVLLQASTLILVEHDEHHESLLAVVSHPGMTKTMAAVRVLITGQTDKGVQYSPEGTSSK